MLIRHALMAAGVLAVLAAGAAASVAAFQGEPPETPMRLCVIARAIDAQAQLGEPCADYSGANTDCANLPYGSSPSSTQHSLHLCSPSYAIAKLTRPLDR